MTDGNRGKSNARLRIRLDQMIAAVPVGAEIKTDSIAQEFQRSHKGLIMNTRRASMLIREREDVQWIDNGLWQKVGR